MQDFNTGDKVKWQSAGGTSHGHVEKKLTEEMQIKGHTVKASNDNPQYLLKSDSGNGHAAHKPESIDKE